MAAGALNALLDRVTRRSSTHSHGRMHRMWPLAWLAAGALAPWLIVQGRRVRLTTLRLPEPQGDRSGQWRMPWPNGSGSPAVWPSLVSELAAGSPRPPLRLLLLGDSSMAGVGAAHQREALSGALAREFALASGSSDPVSVRVVRDPGANSSPLCVDWQIAARTGLRTRDIAPALAGLLRSNDGVAGREAVPRYDLALVALGVNDATALQSASAFRRDVQALRILLREKHGIGRILWSGLPPIHRFPALPQPLRAVLGRKARELDAVLREWGADYVAMPARLDDAWIADDGFHPGPLAYAAWAAQLRRPLHDAMVQVIGSRELSV